MRRCSAYLNDTAKYGYFNPYELNLGRVARKLKKVKLQSINLHI